MNPEMRRVVLEAETVARGGWSERDVASLAESTRGLRCDDAELARLLALPVADHGHREEVFTTDPSFHASVFALAEGETIPLHDHPGLDVISKVLRGRIRVRTYEWIDASSLVADDRGEMVLGIEDAAIVLRKSPGTLHTITAIEATAFLDLFAPYYDDEKRPCSYYVVADSAAGRHRASRRDASAPVASAPVSLRVVTWEEARQ
jgi:PCO_ADO